jgi:hypothetical protein
MIMAMDGIESRMSLNAANAKVPRSLGQWEDRRSRRTTSDGYLKQDERKVRGFHPERNICILALTFRRTVCVGYSNI